MTVEKPFLGVCYYPEHWPEERWADDATKMKALGIAEVRIGEFAWSRIEPAPGRFDWAWLDRAIDTLAGAGLDIMLGTPTATPPKWLIDRHPDILAIDADGNPRKFGSRRHYCFSSKTYAREAARIVEAVASRFGEYKAVTAWQTDNEYGCHDTIRSYSADAAEAFRGWLKDRYEKIEALNTAWGAVFWSQEYRSFEEIDPPNLTVTEPNPSHVLDFYRFSSDQVVKFNRLQADIVRRHSPGRPILHNYMGFFFAFDHFAVADELDAVGWDSYPLGFLDLAPFPAETKEKFIRQGHPDIAAFHHDLYRATGRGRWRVLEQQPGPVNWAPNNPAPLPGMVRLWSLEAFAHGAESVNYFRWRQAPFAQEQMHAGLERPDFQPAPAYAEAEATAADLEFLDAGISTQQADVAIVFSYDAHWLFEAHPQGAGWNYSAIVFHWYAALRRFGLNIDLISPDMPFDGYKIVIAPSLPILTADFISRVEKSDALFVFGPRTGSKSASLTIPDNLAPGLLQRLMPVKVTYSESLPDTHDITGSFDGADIAGRIWLDHLETDLTPEAGGLEGGFLYRHENVRYLATLPDDRFIAALIARLLAEASVVGALLPEEIRVRRNGDLVYCFNYGPAPMAIPDAIKPSHGHYLIGEDTLNVAGVAVWRDGTEKTGGAS